LTFDHMDQSLCVARLRGRIYDQLYSAAGLSRSNEERGALARALAIELEQLIRKNYEELFVSPSEPSPVPITSLNRFRWPQSSLAALRQTKHILSTSRAIWSASNHYSLKSSKQYLATHHKAPYTARRNVSKSLMSVWKCTRSA
jgi:hypothetical protein